MKDLIIVGAGASGLSAALYAGILKMEFIVLEAAKPGGLALEADNVENLLGFNDIRGSDLVKIFMDKLNPLEVKINHPEPCIFLELNGETKRIKTPKSSYEARSIIIATGSRFLGLASTLRMEEEARFLGKGLSYCPECDSPLFKDKTVMVVGSSLDALFMKGIARKIYYLGPIPQRERRQISKELLEYNDIEYLEGRPLKILGDSFLTGINIDGKEIPIDGLFVTNREGGAALFRDSGLLLDDNHFLTVNRSLETNISGVFACGDIIGYPFQIAKSIGEGAVAALGVYRYLTGEDLGDLGWKKRW